MKKTYLNPTTDVVLVFVQQMMAGSQALNEEGGDLNNAAETEATSGNLSRRRTVWDDEEDMEEDY